MMTDDYTPIDCHTYSEYELAILRRWKLRVSWQDDAGLSHLEVLLPLDLQTHDHAEYLIAETGSGEQLSLRLDWISEAQRLDV